MSYMVTLTFDLKNAESVDYDCLESELKKIHLMPKLKGNDGKFYFLPRNTYAGEVAGKDGGSIRNEYVKLIKLAFNNCKVKGKFYVVVGNDWSWSIPTVS